MQGVIDNKLLRILTVTGLGFLFTGLAFVALITWGTYSKIIIEYILGLFGG